VLEIDAFDQPNVQESKDLTKKFLDEYGSQGKLDGGTPTFVEDGLAVYATNGGRSAGSVEALLRSFLSDVKPGDYVALLAYLTRNPKHEALLQDIRRQLLESKRVATT